MSRARIIETDAGVYMPQFKDGWLSRWRFFKRDADQDKVLLVSWIETFDPANAAQFTTHEEAHAFLSRVLANAEQRNQEDSASRAREFEGVRVKRIVS